MNQPAPEPSQEREEQLAVIISQIADQITGGHSLELEDVCHHHPEFRDEITDIWGTLVLTDVAAVEHRQTIQSLSPSTDRAAQPLPLPYQLNQFLLEEEIGRGGMGIVYRAARMPGGEPVAIKLMLKGEFATTTDRQRFEAEAQAAATIEHPHVIPIFEMGEHQGRPFFCMKFVQGQTLAQALLGGPMAPPKAVSMLLKICQGVEEAHRHGVTHRDLKPSNVLLDQNDTPFVCDFGLAKQTDAANSLTRTGAVIGTPSYMAPEQAAGARGQVDATSDVYSLGAILYHMLTGRPPFWASSQVDTLLMVLEQDPIPPQVLNRKIDRKLEMIVLRCLQKPQDLRYASAELLAKDLEAYLNNDSISAAEGRFGQIASSLFRETHHAPILENWGLIWIWHSLVVLVASIATNVMYWGGMTTRLYYELMWIIGLGAWSVVFWWLRRRVGPVTFVERQIAHIWGASMIGIMMLFPFEGYLGLPLLRLAPILSVVAGMTFVCKAGILSGTFYIQAVLLFVTSIWMALVPDWAMTLFGVVCALCFFVPGYKYYRQRARSLQLLSTSTAMNRLGE